MVRTLPLCYLARNLRDPSAQSPRRPVFSAYGEPCRLAYTGRLSAVRGGAKVHARFIIETERARVSHHSACLSTLSL